jgi:hypothetical protein
MADYIRRKLLFILKINDLFENSPEIYFRVTNILLKK